MDRPLDGTRTQLAGHPNRLPRWFVVALAAAPAALLAVFYVWPFATLLARALDGSNLTDLLSRRRTWNVLWFTAWQATVSTIATIVAGFPATWAIARFSFPGRALLRGALTAVFVLPTVVVGAAFVALLPKSLEQGPWAIIAAHVMFNLAVVVRTVGASWQPLSDELTHAAATLGASPWRSFRYVTLPLLRPAVLAAAAIVFLFTFTSFGVVRVLGGVDQATVEVEVWRRATQLGDIGGAAMLATLQLALLAALVAWATNWQRRRSVASSVSRRHRLAPPRGRQRWAVAAVATSTWLAIALPLVALVERSFRVGDGYSLTAWRSLGGNEIRPGLSLSVDPLDALTRSVVVAAWATVLSVLIGGAAVLAIDALGRAGHALDAGLMLPLGTSAVTIGFGMLITFDADPVDWRASWWLIPVGHALVAVPFVVRTALGVLRGIPGGLREAAATLGASPLRAWAGTTLPLLRRPLLASAGLAAAISLGEFGATSFLSRSGEDTVPIAISRLLGRTGAVFQAQAFVLATLLAAMTMAVVIGLDWLAGDRNERDRRHRAERS